MSAISSDLKLTRPRLFQGWFVSGAWAHPFAIAGLVVALAFLFGSWQDPTGTLSGGHTDHIAHVGETRMFPRVGPKMWRVPAADLFRRLTPAEIARLPPDVRRHTEWLPNDTHWVPGYAPDRPLVLNYSKLPRCYPPGVFLVGAPSALLYHYGLISFGASNRLFIALLAFGWYVAVRTWTLAWKTSPPSRLRQLGTAVVAVYVWYWMIEGFYDVFAVGVASLGVHALLTRKPASGVLSLGMAGLIHARLIALGPIGALAAWDALRGRRRLSRGEWLAFGVGALAAAGALAFAVWIQPTLALHAAWSSGLKNVTHPGARTGNGPVIAYAAITLGFVWQLWREGSRRDAVILALCCVAFSTQRYLTPWYWLLILPWSMMPSLDGKETRTTGWARATMTFVFYLASLASKWF
jgi:hypothetical protein